MRNTRRKRRRGRRGCRRKSGGVILEEQEEKPTLIVTYEDGENKHQIIKVKNLYQNRYFVKDGKARSTTKGVKNLPTAISALKKRFPKAEEIK